MADSNWKNRTLFHGDNLDYLRALNSESVDLIATDPPFNKGRDFHATPDSLAKGTSFQDRWSWEKDVHQDWVDQITDDHPKLMEAIESARYAHSDGMGAYMCFMAVRLLEMHRVLKDRGSLYLHCDPTASHYLKAILDAIFSQKNFKNEIIWNRTTNTGSSKSRARRFSTDHDTILSYTKSTSQATFNTEYRPYSAQYIQRYYMHDDGDGRGPYQLQALKTVSDTRRKKLESEGRLVQGRGRYPRFKDYLQDKPGVAVNSIWTDIEPVNPVSREKVGYPTQKPLALYERIIKASSNEDDMVLDPFAGCATTCIAAERLKRQWAGIDIWDKAHEVVIERLQKEGLAAPDGSARETLPFYGKIHYCKKPPKRTDEKDTAAPFLQVTEKFKEPEGPKMSRAEMYEHLLKQFGYKCQGCDRVFDDHRYLELDHNTPRSDGGLNHITNRILLCSPCNRAKSNQYTLSGLRRMNKKNGWMVK